MDIFWSEMKFWWKRRVKAWDLFFGVPLCAYLSYLLLDSVHNSITGSRLSHNLHRSPQAFYLTTGATFLVWLVCLLLTVLKAISLLWPTEIEVGTNQPLSTGPTDVSVWPPPPKEPNAFKRLDK
jgi:hypothetical protein